MSDRDFEFTFGDITVPAQVPLHMLDRFRVYNLLTDDFPDEEALPRCCAIIGLCWAGDDLGVPTLRSLKYDVVEFGLFVHDVLHGRGIRAAEEDTWVEHVEGCKSCTKAGPACEAGAAVHEAHARTLVPQALSARERVIDSIPTPAEVEAAAAPFGDQEETSTANT